MVTLPDKRFSPALLCASFFSCCIYFLFITLGVDVAGFSAPIALSAVLTAASLFILASFSNLARMALLVALSLFLLAHFLMIQLEAQIFSLGQLDSAAVVGLSLLAVGVAAPFVVASHFFDTRSNLRKGTFSRLVLCPVYLLRVTVCATTFPILYFLAGIAILPFVQGFYAGIIPPLPELMLWQWLRGMVFTVSTIPLIASFSAGPLAAVGVFALVFPILGGIAPLLLPNPVMPPEVRLVHGFEIVASYIAFGAVLGFLLHPSAKKNPLRAVARGVQP
ncbi:hypothetical protein [Haliea sp. E17]|uniref:hypothetical protein n=1 Tax=Haliea sp. E17 TaxID=3401576 RepID=UPI003AAC7568